jgi:hypothetical protein
MNYLPLISATVIMLVILASPQKPVVNNFRWLRGEPGSGRTRTVSAFERQTDEVAIAPDQTAIAATAKFIEGQFEIQRYGGQVLRANAGARICNIHDGARAHAGLRAEEQKGILAYFCSADRPSVIHHSCTQRTSCRSSVARRAFARRDRQ